MSNYLPDCSELIRRALAEDIGAGDVTTQLTVDEALKASADFVAKQHGIVAGKQVAKQVLAQLDPAIEFTDQAEEGESVEPGQVLFTATGSAQAILTAERVALNFLQRMSGVATMTSRFVALTAGTQARIVDTRKTTPGLRALEKYAVRVGGGRNHRFGLFDAIMIKDNHIAAAGGIGAAVERAIANASHTLSITVECDTLDQAREAVDAGADILLLDNMTPEQLAEAVELVAGQAMTEASGGVNEETVAEIARTGVDIISVGALTHSAPALDISLDLRIG
ncbi:MAG TPA: carboxylating nicotinate-nucleotide diphosphorylase [Chthonomonadaceae bacterium]|nr:carboxylating nicotinate-nucleotide diphosphorylase [Chthonomonadaceae bacterium]